MKLRDLITELEELADEAGDDAEVRIASQPNWPFEYSLTGVGLVANVLGESEDGTEEDAPNVVYLAAGAQLGYLPGAAREAVGW